MATKLQNFIPIYRAKTYNKLNLFHFSVLLVIDFKRIIYSVKSKYLPDILDKRKMWVVSQKKKIPEGGDYWTQYIYFFKNNFSLQIYLLIVFNKM